MSEDRPRKSDDENTLVWFSADDLQKMAGEAQRLAEDPEAIREIISKRWMEDTELLHASFRKLMDQVGSAETLTGALKIAMTAMKIHDAKQEMTRPMVRRILEAWEGKGKLAGKRPNKQISGRGRSSLRAQQALGGGQGQSGDGPDSSEGGRTTGLDIGPDGLEVPVSEGPGYRGPDSQDD